MPPKHNMAKSHPSRHGTKASRIRHPQSAPKRAAHSLTRKHSRKTVQHSSNIDKSIHNASNRSIMTSSSPIVTSNPHAVPLSTSFLSFSSSKSKLHLKSSNHNTKRTLDVLKSTLSSMTRSYATSHLVSPSIASSPALRNAQYRPMAPRSLASSRFIAGLTKQAHNSTQSLRRHFASTTTTTSTDNNDQDNSNVSGHSSGDIQAVIQRWAEINYRGMEFLRSGTVADLDAAERCFLESASLMEPYSVLPFRSLSLANLASCLMRQGQYTEAIQLFQPVLQQLPMYSQVTLSQIATIHMELASALELNGQHQLAVKELQLASSRFVHAAGVYLSKIQHADITTNNLVHKSAITDDSTTTQTSSSSSSSSPTSTTFSDLSSAPEGSLMRDDTRLTNLITAIDCWRTALGCRFSATVLQHKLGETEQSLQQLKKLSTVYEYYLSSIESIKFFISTPQALEQAEQIAAEVKEVQLRALGLPDTTSNDSDTIHQYTRQQRILMQLAPCPDEARVITHDLVQCLTAVDTTFLDDLFKQTCPDQCSILHSLGAMLIDQGNFDDACEVYKHSVKLVSSGLCEDTIFMNVASEASKSLRLLYERLLHVHASLPSDYDTNTATKNKPITLVVNATNYALTQDESVSQLTDDDLLAHGGSRVSIANKKQLEDSITKINKCRATIFGIFANYLETHIHLVQPDLMNGITAGDTANTDGTTSSSSSSSSVNGASTSQFADLQQDADFQALPQDVKDLFKQSQESIKADLDSGQIYERFRETMKQEQGDQFDEDNPELMRLKPRGYIALHERHLPPPVAPVTTTTTATESSDKTQQ